MGLHAAAAAVVVAGSVLAAVSVLVGGREVSLHAGKAATADCRTTKGGKGVSSSVGLRAGTQGTALA